MPSFVLLNQNTTLSRMCVEQLEKFEGSQYMPIVNRNVIVQT